MSMTYDEELQFVAEADDDLFPSFLFTSLYNDFDDNYYQKSFVDTKLASDVKKLRRRYNDFFEWVDAMEVYNQYMKTLEEKYGGKRVIKNALKIDAIDEPIPAMPKLKNTKRNRQFMRSGITPARKVEDAELPSKEEVFVIARQTLPGRMGGDVDEDLRYEKVPKPIRKHLRAVGTKMAGRHRRQNMYRNTGTSAGTDFIIEYLNQAKQGMYDSRGNVNDYENMSIIEMMEQEERETLLPEEMRDDELNTSVIVNGRLVNRKEQMKIEILKQLSAEGFDVLGNNTRGMTKKAVKMIRSQIGEAEPLTKKELKKIKKRSKKDRERIERQRDSNAALERTLLGNKFDFDNSGGALSFRLKDIYRD